MIDVNDMLRVRRIPADPFKRKAEAFVLYRWEPHELIARGVYQPISAAMSASDMLTMLRDIELDDAAVSAFEAFCSDG